MESCAPAWPSPPSPVVYLTCGHCTPGSVVKELKGWSCRVRPLDQSLVIRSNDHLPSGQVDGTCYLIAKGYCLGSLWGTCGCTGGGSLGFCIDTALVVVGNPFGWQGLAECQIRWWWVDHFGVLQVTVLLHRHSVGCRGQPIRLARAGWMSNSLLVGRCCM